jgi:cystathionine beta-lyase
MKHSTRCVHSTDLADPYGAIAPPIYQTATFRQPTATEFGEYDYTRSGNPTRALLERQLAELEEGAYACAFASGMAAITALTRLVEQGEEIIAGDDLYGGTVRLLEKILPRQGIAVRYVDTTDLSAVQAALTPQTRLILIETPSNPLLRISDIRGLAEIAHAERVLLAVDNSMLSPCLQRPLILGAHLVIHSATKFLCGHSDVTAGAVIANDPALHARIAFQQNAEGAGLSPFESWLLFRGMKTLALRVERQNDSALKVAQFLELSGKAKKVYHPGFKNHPGHQIHRSQADGDGAVVTFTTGDEEFSKRIVEATRLFAIAVSFGSVGSTISLPYRMSHASIPETLKDRLAPPADLVRLSVGIEDANDLIADLQQALTVAAQLRAEAASVS